MCKQRKLVMTEDEIKHKMDKIRGKGDHPAPAMASVAPQLVCP